MLNQSGRRRYALWIVLSTAALILITRMLALTHNWILHPDEGTFYLSANSLLNAILHPGMEFVEQKEYPEGAYCFQMIFQFLGKVFSSLTAREPNLLLWGRLASVGYFIGAVILGMRLIWRYLGKGLTSLVIYGLTMCFSLFFIEQSRYGTGDMVSLFLLLLLLNITARAMETSPRMRWRLAAFFVCGVLGAVKYPLVFFVLIPLGAVLSQSGLKKPGRLVLFLLAVGAGFFLFSPKAMLDPGYVLRVIRVESNAYLTGGNPRTVGGPVHHLLTMLLYTLLYSDFPLLPLLVLGGFVVRLGRTFGSGWRDTSGSTAFLFQVIVPGVCLVFFGYNLFASLLLFRTYTPYFGILTLYTAVAAERLLAKPAGLGRAAVLILTACMVFRGIWMVWLLSDESRETGALEAKIAASVDESWQETYLLDVFPMHLPYTEPENVTLETGFQTLTPLILQNEGMEIKPGQLVITSAYEFYLGADHLLPVSEEDSDYVRQWKEFKQANQDFFVGQLYPDYCYYLSGGWLRGGTLSQYEIPSNYVYYRGQ